MRQSVNGGSLLTSIQSYGNGNKQFRIIASEDTLVDSSIRLIEGEREGSAETTITSVGKCGSSGNSIFQPKHSRSSVHGDVMANLKVERGYVSNLISSSVISWNATSDGSIIGNDLK